MPSSTTTADRSTSPPALRRDEHRDFGGEWSFGADAQLCDFGDVAADRARYGEGFKAPTLFQLLSDFGNAALQPERSRSYDVGHRASSDGAGAVSS